MLAMPKAGSSKLDLSSAEMIIFMEPWTLTRTETIAISMVCRKSHKPPHDVEIIKLVSKSTIEEELLLLR